MLFERVGVIMKLAPIGAFGAMAFTIGKYGISTLLPLGKLMAMLLPHLPAVRLRRARPIARTARLQHLQIPRATSRKSC